MYPRVVCKLCEGGPGEVTGTGATDPPHAHTEARTRGSAVSERRTLKSISLSLGTAQERQIYP
jgi:hypothetical protein